MSSRRGTLADVLAVPLAATGTAWLATLAWRGFTRDPGSYLWPLLLVAVVVALAGVGLRRLRLSGGLVLLGQLVASGVAVSMVVTGSPLPVGSAGTELLREVGAAVHNAQHYRAPVPADAPIGILLVLGGWLCLILVDLCASTLRRASLAGLPLLAIYSVPVSMLGGGVAWWAFALTAGGFLLMLYLQHSEATTRWGRSLEQPGPYGGRSSTIRAGAGTVGLTATALAVFVPLFVPTLSFSVFGFGPGEGEGDGVSVTNPMTDLRRDLQRDENVPLLRFRTDDPNPSYLRIAALNWFTDNEWTTGDRALPPEQQAQGPIPLTGVDPSVPRTQHDYEVTALAEFESRWLPTQYPVSRISAEGDWRYDVETRDFLAYADGLDTAGLSYSFTAVELELEAEQLAASPSSAGEVDSTFRDLPGDFPAMVSNLAIEVTREHPSTYEKAVALQEWFREEGGFRYSLDNVPQGNGPDELVQFLTEGENGRVGYCEQFASAMAAMARSLGIPARVAVGFLTPQEIEPGTYEYSSFDMHAWPELYFTGAGWVRFEPTPASRASGVPSYTTQDLFQQPEDDPSQQPSGAAGPSLSPGANPRLDEGALPEDQSPAAERGFPLARVAGTGGVVVLVAVVLLFPGAVRRRQSATRLTGSPELAWDELEATALDLGIPWPGGRSPRQIRDRLVPHLGAPGDERADDSYARPPRGRDVAPRAAAALDRLVLALERLRYSRGRDAGDPQAVADDARMVVASLHDGSDTGARRRARWWPVSVLPWRRRTPAAAEQPVLVRHGGVVDHVG